MKKTTTITATLIAAALFAGTASANDQQSEDILHGGGQVASGKFEPYVQIEAGPQETGDYLLWNQHETEGVNRAESFVQGESNQDNRDDLRDRV